jgi:hypothetical protein
MSMESHGGVIFTGGNQSILRKTCPTATNATWTDLGANLGLRVERTTSNCLNHGMASSNVSTMRSTSCIHEKIDQLFSNFAVFYNLNPLFPADLNVINIQQLSSYLYCFKCKHKVL